MKNIEIKYKNVGEYHIITSDDVDGLYVLERDLKTVFASAEAATHTLLKERTGKECQFNWREALKKIKGTIPVGKTSGAREFQETIPLQCE